MNNVETELFDLVSSEVVETFRLGMIARLGQLRATLKNSQDDTDGIAEICDRLENIAGFGAVLCEIADSKECSDDEYEQEPSDQEQEFKKELRKTKKREPLLPNEEEE